MERVITYIDGYNLYYGLRAKHWKWFYWLNIQALARHLLKPEQALLATKYFTTVVSQPEDKRRRQATFLEALQTLPDFTIYYGQYLSDTVTCRNCGHSYTAYHEKMTDANIAVELLADAFQDEFDVARLLRPTVIWSAPSRLCAACFPQTRCRWLPAESFLVCA